jgi:hypothetical protein
VTALLVITVVLVNCEISAKACIYTNIHRIEVRTTHFFLAKHDIYSYTSKVLWFSLVVPDLIQHTITRALDRSLLVKDVNNSSACT